MKTDNPILIALQEAKSSFKAGDNESALHACETVLEHVPNHPLAHLMAGLLQQQDGKPSDAIRHLRFAIAHDPNDMETRDALSMCLLEVGRYAEALPHIRQVVASQPDNANARYNLGRCLLDLRNFSEAERVYTEHVAKNPGDAEAFNHLGLARLAKGDSAEAEKCFRTAIRLNSQDSLFHVNLAQALAHRGRSLEAADSFDTAIKLDPSSAVLRTHHGWFLIEQGHVVQAEDRFREALQREPEHPGAAAGLAVALDRRDEVSVGLQLLRPYISAAQAHPQVAVSYADLSRRIGKPEQALPVVRRAIRPGVPKLEEAALRFAEGDLLDAVGEVDAAFDAYQKANVAQGSTYDGDAHAAFVDALISVFTPELFESIPKPKTDSSSSLIVCGMPRAGISLVEHILSRHPDVHGAGALDDLPTMAGGLRHYIGGQGEYPGLVRSMDEDLVESLASARMESLRRVSDVKFVIDRQPNNFLHLGLAAIISPNARVIHCDRDPIDTCLSCYFKHMGGPGFAFSTKLDSLSKFYREYRRLMDHWAKVLPMSVLHVRYEDLVADVESQCRRMFDFMGQPWDKTVLEFTSAEALGHEFAYEEARQPIFSSSVGKSERYRHRLGPLVTLEQLRQ